MAAVDVVRADHVAGLQPIDDVRGSALYRRDVAAALERRAISRAVA